MIFQKQHEKRVGFPWKWTLKPKISSPYINESPVHPLGDLYIGEWSDGLRSGQGTLTKARYMVVHLWMDISRWQIWQHVIQNNFAIPQYANICQYTPGTFKSHQRSKISTLLNSCEIPWKGEYGCRDPIGWLVVEVALPGQWWLLWRLLAECLSGQINKGLCCCVENNWKLHTTIMKNNSLDKNHQNLIRCFFPLDVFVPSFGNLPVKWPGHERRQRFLFLRREWQGLRRWVGQWPAKGGGWGKDMTGEVRVPLQIAGQAGVYTQANSNPEQATFGGLRILRVPCWSQEGGGVGLCTIAWSLNQISLILFTYCTVLVHLNTDSARLNDMTWHGMACMNEWMDGRMKDMN